MACRRLPYYHRFLHRENFSSPLKVFYRKPLKEEKGYTGKYQWDLIHNPKAELFSWLEDEHEAEMISISDLLTQIRNANQQEKPSVEIMQDQCPQVCYKDYTLEGEKLKYLQVNCTKEFENAPIDENITAQLINYKLAFGEKKLVMPGEKSTVIAESISGDVVYYQFHEAKVGQAPIAAEITDNFLFEFAVLKEDKDKFEEYLYPPTSNFEKYQDKIFDHEGGYVDDPVDIGGATNKGITFNTFEAYAQEDLGIEPTLENLKALTNEQAAIIYKKRYWDKIKADDIKNGSIAYLLYDFNVNAGGNAVKELQRALVDLGNEITVDGAVGNKTIEAINKTNAKLLFDKFKQRRLDYYQNIVDKSVENYKKDHPNATEDDLLKYTQKKFEKGWKNRTNSIEFEP